ncbi:hypothetical protein [Escherichia coli]|uniref:hypothetical protein n=1 Tax=Escherichia coli TaxID=562 RepID=UPI00388D2E7B
MYIKLPGADVELLTEGNIMVRYCECHMDPAGSEIMACQYDLRGNREDLPSDHLPVSEMARTGKTRSHSR